MLNIISTVGTTVFGKTGTPLSDAAREFDKSAPSNLADILAARNFPGEKIYQQALADLKAKSGNFLRMACAEINAIEGIHQEHKVSSGNEYYFLASQTGLGVLAARVVADFCKEYYSASRSDVIIIPGLQVNEPDKFRQTGLPYLVQTVYRLLNDAKEKRLIAVLNPTGGFKATIPYLTLVGMLRQTQGVEISCIHETSSELITLAGLPIALDIGAIQKISSVLEECDAQQTTGLERTKLAKGLGLSRHETVEAHPLWSLFEQFDNDHYILSGLGSIALAELRARANQVSVWLSEKALERLNSAQPNSEERRNFEKILNSIHDPQLRKNNIHTYPNPDDAPVYKLGRQKERAFYWDYNDYVLILEFSRHTSESDYDTVPTHLSNYSKFHEWKRS